MCTKCFKVVIEGDYCPLFPWKLFVNFLINTHKRGNCAKLNSRIIFNGSMLFFARFATKSQISFHFYRCKMGAKIIVIVHNFLHNPRNYFYFWCFRMQEFDLFPTALQTKLSSLFWSSSEQEAIICHMTSAAINLYFIAFCGQEFGIRVRHYNVNKEGGIVKFSLHNFY